MKNIKKVICCLMAIMFISGCGGKPQATYVETIYAIPQDVQDLMTDFNNVATFEVISTEPVSYYSEASESTEYAYIAKVKILNSFKGPIKNGNIIYIMQHGDNAHQIYRKVEETLGYFIKGQRYLGFLEKSDFTEEVLKGVKEYYFIESYCGQFLINENNEIIKHPSEYDLFPDAKTVDDIIEQIP